MDENLKLKWLQIVTKVDEMIEWKSIFTNMINEECKKKTINEHTKYKQKKKKKKLNLEEQLLWREKYLENVCVYKRERERENWSKYNKTDKPNNDEMIKYFQIL